MSPINKKNGMVLVSQSPGGLQTGCCFYSCRNCEECNSGETPYRLTVTMTGLSDCACQLVDGVYYKTNGVAATINEIKWVLGQVQVPNWQCVYTKAADITDCTAVSALSSDLIDCDVSFGKHL